MLLCGCAAGNKLADFKPGDAGKNSPVSIPVECDAFLQAEPQPKVTAKTDARVAYTRAADALDTVNGRVVAARECSADQRQAYAGKGGH